MNNYEQKQNEEETLMGTPQEENSDKQHQNKKSCCGSNEERQGRFSVKHMFHMILCCGLPILILLSVPFIAKKNIALASVLSIIAPFICPLMMGSMLFMMFRRKEN